MDKDARFEIARQLLRAKQDPLYFFSKLKTLDQDEEDPTRRVKVYPVHKPYLQNLICLAKTERRLAIYKARRMIVTWTCCGIAAHDLLFFPGSYIGLIAQKEEKAGKLIGRIRFYYEHLPNYLKIGLPKLQFYRSRKAIDVKAVASFPDAPESVIEAYPEGEDQLRADGYSMIYWDEVGYCDDQMARMTYAAAVPALGQTGRLIMSSTPPRYPQHFWYELVTNKYLGQ